MIEVGRTRERFDGVRSIAVLRGGGLGDLLFAVPAIEALAAAYPEARITLLGTPLHRALLAGRPSPVSDVEILPVAPGIRDAPARPEAEPSETVAEFLDRLRARRFDLAVQVHGGGRNSNPVLLGLGARHTIGTRTPDAADLERSISYLYYQHEVMRALEVVGLAGAEPVTLEPRIRTTGAERASARECVPDAPGGRIVLHPGATDPRRRWPATRFAEVTASLVATGARVAVIGDDTDAEAAQAIVSGVRDRGQDPDMVVDLTGRLPLGETAGLLAIADAVLANDSGPRHLAVAVGAPTVGVFWVGNALNAAPFGRERHRIHLSWTTRCPVCGVDVTQVGWTAERCEHDDSFVDEVDPAAVLADVLDLTARSLPPRDR
ncbi:glycosyltransferase family 9 protein [Labedella phragmitis]|uniref:Glycosyltransferase family 9 protein n=1 Tax=Labedella phragmitis TaxID=2498849 RepID=A0A444PUI3_9MICO|nr:glycosyltransferase family 9 protein [Labedella phragmitis]RWZ51526.1 glycosyltransferase family 9 protein [Labedella phragmitis]